MPALEIFRAGRHTDMNGQVLTFDAADLQASVDAYDPAVFRAPLVVGHPKHDDPAYGWVKDLNLQNGILEALPEQVESQFAEMVNGGRFPKISASFFLPNSPSNPVPGVYYLRHVGFLGAQAPAVKGLKTASFAEESQSFTVEFAMPCQSVLPRFLRGLREWFLTSQDTEVADQVIPNWMIAEIEDENREPDEPISQAAFSEPEEKDMPKTADFAARESSLQAKEAEIAARENKLKAQEQAVQKRAHADFADGLVTAGKLLPRDRDGVVAFMEQLNDVNEVSFAEGDQTITKPGLNWFQDFLSALPTQVDYAEHSQHDDEQNASSASFAAPKGFTVDPERLELHNKALAYQAQHKCDYSTAINAVS